MRLRDRNRCVTDRLEFWRQRGRRCLKLRSFRNSNRLTFRALTVGKRRGAGLRIGRSGSQRAVGWPRRREMRVAGSTGIATGVAGRYAKALFELAEGQSALDQISTDVAALKDALTAEPSLIKAFKDPSVTRDALGGVATALAAKMNLGATTRNFLGLMAKNRRLGVLPQALDAFQALVAEKRGETTADVVSATPLSDAQQSALAQALSGAAGKTVHMKTSVDPELIGGIVVKLGSKMIDASLRSKLSRLRQSMKEVG